MTPTTPDRPSAVAIAALLDAANKLRERGQQYGLRTFHEAADELLALRKNLMDSDAARPAEAGALDGVAVADALLKWNRARPTRPIAIGMEYVVAGQVMERAALQALAAAKCGEELWCLHLRGPDDVFAAPSRLAAEDAARYVNEHFKNHEVKPNAVAATWPHSAESHAESLEDWAEQWGIAAAPAAPAEPTGHQPPPDDIGPYPAAPSTNLNEISSELVDSAAPAVGDEPVAWMLPMPVRNGVPTHVPDFATERGYVERHRQREDWQPLYTTPRGPGGREHDR